MGIDILLFSLFLLWDGCKVRLGKTHDQGKGWAGLRMEGHSLINLIFRSFGDRCNELMTHVFLLSLFSFLFSFDQNLED